VDSSFKLWWIPVLFQEFSACYSLPGGFQETNLLGLALADPFCASRLRQVASEQVSPVLSQRDQPWEINW
jgi:hypothetical protein